MKELNYFLQIICERLDIPFTLDDAKLKNVNKFASLSYAAIYGGYQLVLVEVGTGAHYNFAGLNYERKSKKEMLCLLKGIIVGINMSTKIVSI